MATFCVGCYKKKIIQVILFLNLGCSAGFVAAGNNPDVKTWNVISSQKTEIIIDGSVVREKVPATLFGFNINYRTFQEQLWDRVAQRPEKEIISLLKPFKNALYRYPGGSIANSFQWDQAVGDIQGRKPQKTFFKANKPEKVYFGIDEYVNFVNEVGGYHWYVLNLVGINPLSPMSEADSSLVAGNNKKFADYYSKLISKAEFPHFYQLGNELDRSKYEWLPDKYTSRSLDTIKAIKKVDPAAKFVIFGRDFKWKYKKHGSIEDSRPQEFMRKVHEGLPEVNNYSLHHYYDGKRTDGKSRSIPFWIKLLTRSIDSYKKFNNGLSPGVWITEHARQMSSSKPGKDDTRFYVSGLGGAISTADYLIALSQIPEVQGAIWHGLNAGPWQLFDYSVQYRDLRPRPVYWGLRVLRTMDLPVGLATITKSRNESGYQGGYDVRAAAFRDEDNSTLGLWVVNRLSEEQSITIKYPSFKAEKIKLQHFFIAGSHGINADSKKIKLEIQLEPAMKDASFSKNGDLELNIPPSSVSSIILHREK